MKRFNKKGFTIVELVIVIAVIAILAGVLIPTFSGIVEKAEISAAVQEARNMYEEYTADFDYKSGTVPAQNLVIKVADDQYVAVIGGKLKTDVVYESEAKVLEAKIGINDAAYSVLAKDANGKYTCTADAQG